MDVLAKVHIHNPENGCRVVIPVDRERREEMWQWMIDEDKERLDDIVEEGTVDGESFEEFHKPWMGNKDDLPKDHWLYGFMESTLQSYEWSALHRIEILWSDETIYRVELSD